jgi:hypothetical protein
MNIECFLKLMMLNNKFCKIIIIFLNLPFYINFSARWVIRWNVKIIFFTEFFFFVSLYYFRISPNSSLLDGGPPMSLAHTELACNWTMSTLLPHKKALNPNAKKRAQKRKKEVIFQCECTNRASNSIAASNPSIPTPKHPLLSLSLFG